MPGGIKITKGNYSKIMKSSYNSCALHTSWVRSIHLWSFMLISQRLFELCSGQKLSLKITKGNNWKIMQGGVIIMHCTPPQYDLSTWSFKLISQILFEICSRQKCLTEVRKDGRKVWRRLFPYPPPPAPRATIWTILVDDYQTMPYAKYLCFYPCRSLQVEN
jgi:hypothetical protein